MSAYPSSSAAMVAVTQSAPAPPCSSGRVRHRSPISPSPFMRPLGIVCLSSFSLTCSRLRFLESHSLTASRNSSCSSVKEKSIILYTCQFLTKVSLCVFKRSGGRSWF